MTASGTHRDAPAIRDLVADLPVQWRSDVEGIGQITAYGDTPSVIYLIDYSGGGWDLYAPVAMTGESATATVLAYDAHREGLACRLAVLQGASSDKHVPPGYEVRLRYSDSEGNEIEEGEFEVDDLAERAWVPSAVLRSGGTRTEAIAACYQHRARVAVSWANEDPRRRALYNVDIAERFVAWVDAANLNPRLRYFAWRVWNAALGIDVEAESDPVSSSSRKPDNP